jgi:2-amino-4-hydroxy-6-hydroxymethyldihydropteridine diphosphokinase
MILIAIGANLPGPGGISPIETCRQAVADMDLLRFMRVRGLSRWYESSPVPPSGQPIYVNAVVHLSAWAGSGLEPGMLLAQLMEIEQRHGRSRSEPNAARTLDLDIIAMGRLVRDAPDPILPHPRAHERGFVLFPLRDVAPGWVHPRLAQSVDALIAALPPQQIRVAG